MEYYSALKRKEILTCGTSWKNLENNTVSEINKSQKDKYYMILYYKLPSVVKFLERR